MAHAKKKSSWTKPGGEAPRRLRMMALLATAVWPLRTAVVVGKNPRPLRPLREEKNL
jgi:hypothetical protein